MKAESTSLSQTSDQDPAQSTKPDIGSYGLPVTPLEEMDDDHLTGVMALAELLMDGETEF